jgi:phosphate-selective porin OprO and OprP
MSSSFRPLISCSLLAIIGGSSGFAADTTAPTTVEQRVAELERQLRILERKQEIAQEDAKNSALPKNFMIGTDKNFSLKIGGYVQADGRFFLDDDTGLNSDQFLIRRARLNLTGYLAPWLTYQIMPDLAVTPQLQDAYANAALRPEFQIQFGQFKQPVGLERIRSDANITFLERGFPTNLAPNRDVGVAVHGDIHGYGNWDLGIFNGTPDGQASSTGDTNDDKDFAARLWLTPFAQDGNVWLKGLGFGVAATLGYDQGTPAATNLGSHKSLGQATIFQYARPSIAQTAANTTVPTGEHTRIYPQTWWAAEQWSVLGEYAISTQDVALNGDEESSTTTAWQFQLGYVITGENASFTSVKPAKPFAPGNGQWGAWEVAVRATGIDFDDDIIDNGFATANSVSSATAYGAALNWYLTNNLKWQFDYEHTVFDGGGTVAGTDRKNEDVASTRIQFSF